MIKHIIIILVLVCSNLTLHAQYVIQPLTIGSGVIQKEQLWNVLLVNNSNTTISCRIDLIIREKVSGLEQITASTLSFILPTGAKQINQQLIGTVRYNYVNQISPRQSDQFLPVGNYMACYRLYNGDLVKPSLLSEECMQFDVEPITEPMLIQPADSSKLAEMPKQFSWIPPTPITLFSQLRYDITITEISEGQHAKEAIENNTPVFTELSLSSNQLTTTQLSATLKKDKWYAWQVTAKDDKNYNRRTEIWVFTIKDSLARTSPLYFLLQEDGDMLHTQKIETNELYVKHYSYLKEHSASVQIIDKKKEVIYQKSQLLLYGDNFLSIPLHANIKKGESYIFLLTDGRGFKHSIQFIRK